MYKVNHEELKSLIREYYNNKLSLFVFGAFGIGKSFIVKEVGKELARERGRKFVEWNKINKEEKDKVFNNPKDYFVLLDERLSEYESSDIKGLPSFQEESEVLNWRIPYWAKFLTQKDSDGVLFFDEMNLASSLVISSVYKIIYDRIIGENKIEDNWLIMGAGNRDSDRAYTFSLPAPVRDRSGEVELIVGNKDNWTNWAVSNGIDSRIIAYINFKESNLYNVDFDNNQKYTTSRGWERTSKLIKDKKVDELFERLVCSSIGEGIGREFIGYCKLIGEVDLEGISKNPTKLKEIKDMGVRYMVISSLAEKFGKEEDYTFSDIIKVSKVLDEDNSAEFVGLLWNLCNSYTRPNKEGKTPFGIDNPKIVKKFYNGYLNTTIKEEEELLNKYGKYITGY